MPAEVWATLTRTREQSGQALVGMARSTGLDLRSLAALEQGALGALPSRVHVLAYLRVYARALDLEAEPLIDRVVDSYPESPWPPPDAPTVVHVLDALARPVPPQSPPGPALVPQPDPSASPPRPAGAASAALDEPVVLIVEDEAPHDGVDGSAPPAGPLMRAGHGADPAPPRPDDDDAQPPDPPADGGARSDAPPSRRGLQFGLLGALALPLVVAVIVAATSALDRNSTDGGQVAFATSPSAATQPAPVDVARAPSATAARPSPAAPPTPTARPEPAPTTATPTAVPGRPPADITVQVLDGVYDDGSLTLVVRALESMGYVVVAQGTAARPYEQTTVFFVNDDEQDAEGLRVRDERFSVVAASPGTLDDTIDLHVVVGADWTA